MKKYVIAMIALLLVATVFAAGQGKGKPDKNVCTTIQSGELLSSNGDVLTMGYDMWGYNYQAHMFNGYYDNYNRPETPVEEGDWLMMKWNDAWLSNKDCDGDLKLDRSDYNAFDTGAWLTNHMRGVYEGEGYSWDVSGTWMLDFAGGTDNRQFVDLVQDEYGNLVGEFWWLTGGNWEYGGTLEGTVTGDDLYLYYERPAPLTYTGEFYGTVGENVITDGTFTDSNGGSYTWTATGTSEKIYETCYWDYFVKIVGVTSDSYLEDGVWYTADGVEIGPVIWGAFATIQEVYNDPCAGYEGILYNSPSPNGFGWYQP